MITQEELRSLGDKDIYDPRGNKIGGAGDVYTGSEGGEPEWLGVRTGLFGLKESLVPLQGTRVEGDRILVPFEKDVVKDAPNVDADADEPLDEEEASRLYRHYGIEAESDTGGGSQESMTRSEEQLRVGVERRSAGKARLRKYVVTEHEQRTVPVQREEVRVEREPITAENAEEAYSGPELTESEHEVTLHEERPVVSTETVPREQVRLETETTTEEESVGADVRREKIEAETPGEGRRRIE